MKGMKSYLKDINAVRVGEIACYEQFFPFSQSFQNACTADM